MFDTAGKVVLLSVALSEPEVVGLKLYLLCVSCSTPGNIRGSVPPCIGTRLGSWAGEKSNIAEDLEPT